jgi:hypothetical protein
MATDKRVIINEIQRRFSREGDYSIESLMKISPTLRNLVDTNGTFSTIAFLTPPIVNQIVREITEARGTLDSTSNGAGVSADSITNTINTLSSLPQLIEIANSSNPFVLTPDDLHAASQNENYEDIKNQELTLLTTTEGNIVIDPETGALIEAPTPNRRILSPEKSPEGHIGPLNKDEVEVFAILLEDEIRREREAQGINHGVDTVDENGKMGLYGLTVSDLVEIGVVSQSAITSWQAIPDAEHEDYAYQAVLLGVIPNSVYEKIPYVLRTTLSWYVLANRQYWLEKLIGPKNFLTLQKIQRLLMYRHALRQWKTTFAYFAQNFITNKSQILGHMLAARIVGERAARAFGLGGQFASIIGRKAQDLFNRGFKALASGITEKQVVNTLETTDTGETVEGTGETVVAGPAVGIADAAEAAANGVPGAAPVLTAAAIDQAAESVPDPTPPSPPTSRRYGDFANVETQPSNEPLRKIPENQGFYDPNRVYPRVNRIGEPDTNRLARHQKIQDTIVGAKDKERILKIPVARKVSPGQWDQPKSPYNARYPYNHVRESESGHVIEQDDTPNNERLHWYHREGTFMEIDRNGSMVRKIIGDGFEVWERDGYIYIGGRANVTIEGNCNIYVKTDCNLQVDGNLNADVHKSVTFSVAKDFNVTAGGSINLKAKEFINVNSTTKNINIKAAQTASMTGNNVNVKANAVLKLSGERKASLASPLGQALLLSGAGTVVVNGTGLALLPAPGFAAKGLAESNRAQQAGGASNGEPVSIKSPREPVHPPLTLEARVDKFSSALSSLAENPNENRDALNSLKKKAVDEGLVTSEDLARPLTAGPRDETPAPEAQPPKVSSCETLNGVSTFPTTLDLSPNVTLGMLLGSSVLKAQHGLEEKDIVCNMKQLAVNVIEPLYEKLGKSNVNIITGLQNPSVISGALGSPVATSFHELGLAIDITLPNKQFSEYYDVAVQLKQQLQYDRLQLEYQLGDVNGTTTYKPWIHIQWQQPGVKLENGRDGSNIRMETRTMKADAVYDPNTLVNLLPASVPPQAEQPITSGTGKNIVQVIDVGPGFNIVVMDDGKKVKRQGTWPWRNYNPGNITNGKFSKSAGSLEIPQRGNPSRYAVFPNYETGRNAMKRLLKGSGYNKLTVSQAIAKWAPAFENETATYQKNVISKVGGDFVVGTLTDAQLNTMMDAIEIQEGYRTVGKIIPVT